MEPVALGVKTPDILERLGAVQQIRAQQAALPGQQAASAGAVQTQRQRQALAGYDFGKHLAEDGTPDLNSMFADPELRAAAGDQFQDVIAKAAGVKGQQLNNMRTMTALRGDQRAAFGELMNGLRGDADVAADNAAGRQKVTQALLQYGEMHGPDAYPVLSAYSGQLQSVPKGKLADALKIVGMQSQAVNAQMSAQQPDYTDTGANLLQTNPNALPGAKGEIPKTLPPGVSILTDQAGAQFAYNPQRNTVTPVGAGRGGGAGGGSAPAPSAAPGAAPSAPAPGFQQPTYPGQAEDIRQQQHDVATIRATADQAPVQRSIYQKILQLSDDTNTGKFTAWLQSNPAISQMSGDSYQELSKYLEKNAIANMQAMGGGGSDARLEAATQASGSTKFNPAALKEVTRFNYATNTALEAFRQGIDEAVGTSNPKYNELPRFKKDWSKNFDIDVFRLENAINDGDAGAQAKILEGLTPAQAKTLMEKCKNLTSLRSTGKLP